MVKFKNPKKITQKSAVGGDRFVEYKRGGKTYRSGSVTNPVKGSKAPGLLTGRVKRDGSLDSPSVNWQAYQGSAKSSKKANLIRGGATNSGRSGNVKRSSGGSTG